jgi:predicted metalloprotease
MSIITRPRLLAGATLALALAGAIHFLGPAQADQRGGDAVSNLRPASTHASNLITGGQQQPQTMEEFLTDVTTDVDAYWEQVFAASDLPTPRVGYDWIPAGQTVSSVCGGESGQLGDTAAAYCPGDDTIYISQQFASDVYDGALDHALPGSSQGYGRTAGDFAVAYIVAHEYGHQVQDELGLFDRYGDRVPTMNFELQADCFAGTWAKSAADQDRLEDGDLQEALDAVLAVGDFDSSNPQHHGTPEQREAAWKAGFDSGKPASCSRYLEAA